MCDLEVVGLEEAGEAVPQEEEVFGNNNSHGTSRSRTVGSPAGLERASEPSNGARRRSMPRKPVPRPGVRTSMAVVAHAGVEQALAVADLHPSLRSAGVLSDIREKLAHGEIYG